MKSPQAAARGFSLIELMVTLAIAAVLLIVAAPGLVTFKRNADLTSATNSLLAAINAARGEAMKRGINALVVPTGNGNDWNAGLVVFADVMQNKTYDAANDFTVLTQDPLPSYLTVTGTGSTTAGLSTTPFIMFDASGYAKDKSAAFVPSVLTISRNDVAATWQETRYIIIARTGRVRSCKPTSASDTNCNAGLSQ